MGQCRAQHQRSRAGGCLLGWGSHGEEVGGNPEDKDEVWGTPTESLQGCPPGLVSVEMGLLKDLSLGERLVPMGTECDP